MSDYVDVKKTTTEQVDAQGVIPFTGDKGRRLTPTIVSGLMMISDAVLIFGAGALVFLAYIGLNEQRFVAYMATLGVTTVAPILLFKHFSLYEFDSIVRLEHQVKKVLMLYSVVFLALVTLAFALKISEEFSRVWAFSWYGITFLTLGASRVAWFRTLNGWGRINRLTRNVVVLGGGHRGERALESLTDDSKPWYRVVGVFDADPAKAGAKVGDFDVNGGIDELISFARSHRVDDILVTLSLGNEEQLHEIFQRLKVLPTHIVLSLDIGGLNPLTNTVGSFNSLPVIKIFERPIDGWSTVLKGVEDRLLALFFLFLTLPVMGVTALLIRLDSPGPVLFRQKRYGFNNELIDVYKFRTMYQDQCDVNAEKLATKSDDRVTQIGRTLRKLSLDELPQFFNVLKGEMSIVGPRPHAIKAKAAGRLYEAVVAEYALRHRVKPGITGWAQVNGWRGETDTEESIKKRVEYDLFYIDNWSLVFDLQIILQTIWVLFKTDEAH